MDNAALPLPAASVDPFPEPFEMLPRDLEFEARQKRRMQNRIAQRNSRDRRRSRQKSQQHQQSQQNVSATKDDTTTLTFDHGVQQEYVTPPCSSSPSSCWSAQDSAVTSPTNANQMPQSDISATRIGSTGRDPERSSVELAQRSSPRSGSLPGSHGYHSVESVGIQSPPYIPTAIRADMNQTGLFNAVHQNQCVDLGPAPRHQIDPSSAHSVPWSIGQIAESYTEAPPSMPTHASLIYQAIMPHTPPSGPSPTHSAKPHSQSRIDSAEPHIQGTTPLHIAASSGDDSMVHFLLQSGVEVNVLDISGLTPLSLAIESGHVQTVCTLLQAGARTS